MILPRPDLAQLGIHYRRIPLLYFRGTVYCDSRLILRVLEEAFPLTSASQSTSTTISHFTSTSLSPPIAALGPIISNYVTDGGVFRTIVALFPPDGPIFTNNAAFLRDRDDMAGHPPSPESHVRWTRESQARGRNDALARLREIFALVEEQLLGDGRQWVSGEEKPGVVDLEAVWPLHWAVVGLKGMKAVPESVVGREEFPRTFTWIERFDALVRKAGKEGKKPVRLDGKAAARYILAANAGNSQQHGEEQGAVDPKDPLGLEIGGQVEVWPTDSGMRHHDHGKLLKLTRNEVHIAVDAKDGGSVRLAMPRWGFKVQSAREGQQSRL